MWGIACECSRPTDRPAAGPSEFGAAAGDVEVCQRFDEQRIEAHGRAQLERRQITREQRDAAGLDRWIPHQTTIRSERTLGEEF